MGPHGAVPKRQRGPTVNRVALFFVGSSPTRSTELHHAARFVDVLEWQTGQLEVLVPFGAWGFESPRRHARVTELAYVRASEARF